MDVGSPLSTYERIEVEVTGGALPATAESLTRTIMFVHTAGLRAMPPHADGAPALHHSRSLALSRLSAQTLSFSMPVPQARIQERGAPRPHP